MAATAPSTSTKIGSASDITPLLSELFPHWQSISITEIPGGITNRIYKAQHDKGCALIRIFGAPDVFSAEDRRKENDIFAQLGDAGHAPRLLGLFGNGRVEEWFEARPATLDEMVSERVLKGVAKAMARLHTFVPRDGRGEAGLWDVLGKWAEEARRIVGGGEGGFERLVGDSVKALGSVERRMMECGSDVVYCHNDLLAGNILVGEEVRLVDFEYAEMNYRGFDVGNFFCECMGGTTDGVVQVDRYPDEGLRRMFCESYVRVGGGDVDGLMEEAERFAMVAHLYWGLWGVVQSVASDVDFPYVKFARQRLELFWKRWKDTDKTK